MNMIRKTLLGLAFTATVAGTLAGATFRGETKEVDLAATCATATWPSIPAACLEGSDGNDVRYVTADSRFHSTDMELRFSVAFQ
jgi:hypothetical protein